MRSVVMVQGVGDDDRSRHAARLSAATGAPLVTFSGVRSDAEALIARALDADRSLIIDVPASVEPMHVVAMVAGASHDAAAIESIVDAHTMLQLLGLGTLEPSSSARARRLVEQLEQSTMITIVQWHALETSTLSLLMALVSHVAPRSRLRLDRGAVEPVAVGIIEREHSRAGWTAILNGEHDPHMTDPRVLAIRFEGVRPFHPERLRAALDILGSGVHGLVVRSAGIVSLASRAALWDHVAGGIDLHPLPSDESIVFGQEIALIGVDLDRAGLTALLAGATLDDAELSAGSGTWATYADPFPSWHTHAHD